MAAFVEFGDAEAAACDILRTDSNLAQIDNITISTDLVGYAANQRWVRVTRTGGLPIPWMQLDAPTIAVDTYGEDKAIARDLASAARAALFAVSGVYSGGGLVLFDVADSQGLTWAPDEPSGPHYRFVLTMITRPW